LPFPFEFYGQTFITATVSSNGNIQFQSDFTQIGDWCGPHSELDYTLMPYYWYMSTVDGGVYTSVSGSAPSRVFNIEWRGCVYDPITYDCDQSIDFEVRLYEGSPTERVDYVYGQVDDTG